MKKAFFNGKIVPFNKAKIGIMTHAFNYGTGVFEGIRGYWNKNKNQMFLLITKQELLLSLSFAKFANSFGYNLSPEKPLIED